MLVGALIVLAILVLGCALTRAPAARRAGEWLLPAPGDRDA